MLAFKYISFHYLRYFFVILIALILFLVGFDYMGTSDDLPSSANLVLIYLVYKAFYAIDMLLPLSLIFAMIITKMLLIRTNALVSFYSLGYSRVDILKPFVVTSTLIILIFISLHTSSKFAQSQELSKSIRKTSTYLNQTKDLFFTYKDKFVYFSNMIPLQERAEGVRVFSVKDNQLQDVIIAKSAVYQNDYWYISDADIITKPDDMGFDSKGIGVEHKKGLNILQGFRPKILDQVYEGKVNFTIKDAIDAYKLLEEQNIDTGPIKGAIYKIFIYPFFVPALVVIIFFLVPISPRFLNVSLFSFGAILSTLLIWGVLYVLIELSNNKVIPSEIGVIAPVVILTLIALRQWRKYRLAT